ncbi:MAG: PIN domain-containing protein [Gammaproteobacteria bacterium]|nr:PIN domain-containing protein [Gammaproteobacteria bacterium]MYE50729.1 PIN domain-containing protein [Gammaproteobacteria bacterium]MYF49565.1 PIN domain-containing protein [Gammaproteobacteria bacterium]MYH15337.1 PIN domain-containing protein [Gammaproteobacteria bacterium]MYK83856.1 PIN domain-containing protein [Gammaproteobacteria bacterium]
MPVTVAFLDASVLYPAPLRDLLLELATSDLYRAKWSDTVHDEWIRALRSRRPDIAAARLERTRRLMDAHVRDAIVSGFNELVPTIRLPDPDDRHIVAAAIRSDSDIILTANLKDFPASAIARYGLTAEHPDGFLARLCHESPNRFLDALARVRARLRNPPVSPEEHLAALRRAGLDVTVAEIHSRTATQSKQPP